MSYILEDIKILAIHFNGYRNDKANVDAFAKNKESLIERYKNDGIGNPQAAYDYALKPFLSRYNVSRDELINDIRLIRQASQEDIDELINNL